jgi:cell division protein FtsB
MLKWLAVVLVVLVALLQYRLWFGVGGMGEFAEVRERVDALEEQNRPLRARNARLAAEVVDLKTGLDAIEERARSDIGMVRSDEQFYWVPGVTVEATQQEAEDSLPETVPLSTETASLPAEVDR